jgi:FkbM family methyltransferase
MGVIAMAIEMNDLIQAFEGSFTLNLKLMHDVYGVQTIESIPRPGSLLSCMNEDGNGYAPIRTNCDPSVAPNVLLVCAWEPHHIELVQKLSAPIGDFKLIDVGANVGLFSRQCLAGLKNCVEVFAYEPDPTNFRHLVFNLQSFPQARCNMVALSDSAGSAQFYLDPNNTANYSLNASAMPKEHKVEMVRCVDTLAESRLWLKNRRPLFYKSDTQGLDEKIVTLMDLAFWDNVFGGILELWRIKKPDFDREKFKAFLDRYPNRAFIRTFTSDITAFIANMDNRLSASDVLNYLASTDGTFEDLAFWR